LKRSGRTSAFKPNIQNQPRKGGVRECFVPRPGLVYLDADYSIAELCSLSQVLIDLYGESEMANAIKAGRELHLETAASILGITYDECVKRHGANDQAVKDARQLAKAANFGLPGGLGAETFIEYARVTFGIELTLQEARDLKDLWLSRYPEMTRYFQDNGDACNRGGGTFTVVQHKSGRIRADCTFTSGCNTKFQGLTADGAKLALYEVAKACYLREESALYGCRPVAFIHDEIIVEAPYNDAFDLDAAAAELSRLMEQSMMRFTPDIPSKATAHAMLRWYKGAEPVYDERGKLIPWEPTTEA